MEEIQRAQAAMNEANGWIHDGRPDLAEIAMAEAENHLQQAERRQQEARMQYHESTTL